MVHLSRLCEEIVLWSTEEFGFMTLDDAWSTGSSIMPQKKNPDFAELMRGQDRARLRRSRRRCSRCMKGLPLAYNKDMQEDKEAAFDAADTLADCLRAVDGMLSTMRVERGADARRRRTAASWPPPTWPTTWSAAACPSGRLTRSSGGSCSPARSTARRLQDLTIDELKTADARFGDDALVAVDIYAIAARRTSEGGTGNEAVADQIAKAREALAPRS